MRTFRALVYAAAALVGVVMLSSALASSASAKGFYVSSGFGWNVDGDSTLPFVNEESGLVGTLAVGTPIDGVPGLRAEVEASFRSHESSIGPFTLEHDTTAVMLNAVYGFQDMGRFEPYVLVGAGVAHTELTFGGIAPLTVENDGFGYQAGVGVNYLVAKNVKLGVGYRYAEFPEVELFGFELDGGSNHSVMATATVQFD